jgi:hypothetical protein
MCLLNMWLARSHILPGFAGYEENPIPAVNPLSAHLTELFLVMSSSCYTVAKTGRYFVGPDVCNDSLVMGNILTRQSITYAVT